MTTRETLDMMRRSVDTLVQEENSVLGRLAAIGRTASSPEGVISFGPDWKVIWADDVMHKFAGYPDGELIGKSLSDLLGDRHKDAWLEVVKAQEKSSRPVARWDSPLAFQLRGKDGEERQMIVRVSHQPVLGKNVFVIHMRPPGSAVDGDDT